LYKLDRNILIDSHGNESLRAIPNLNSITVQLQFILISVFLIYAPDISFVILYDYDSRYTRPDNEVNVPIPYF